MSENSIQVTPGLTASIGGEGTRLAGSLEIRAEPNVPDGTFWASLGEDQVRALRDFCDRFLGASK